jgi:hypothetical protein
VVEGLLDEPLVDGVSFFGVDPLAVPLDAPVLDDASLDLPAVVPPAELPDDESEPPERESLR